MPGWPFALVTSLYPPTCLLEEERILVISILQRKKVGQGKEVKYLTEGHPLQSEARFLEARCSPRPRASMCLCCAICLVCSLPRCP